MGSHARWMMQAQGWTLLAILGVFSATVVTLIVHSQQSLRGYLDARFEAVDARFAAVNTRFDALDRDVQALMDHVFRNRS